MRGVQGRLGTLRRDAGTGPPAPNEASDHPPHRDIAERFSEDIDITVFHADIDAPDSVEQLEALSRTQRERRLDSIRTACQLFISGTLKTQLEEVAAALPMDDGRLLVALDPDDADDQSLLLQYPATTGEDVYVRPAVKIEAAAKSALDPHEPVSVRPYIAGELRDFDLTVSGVTTVNPVRTFWDKVLILHSLRRSFEARGILRGGGQRVSRHYYDVNRMLRTDAGPSPRPILPTVRQAIIDYLTPRKPARYPHCSELLRPPVVLA